MSNQEVAYDRPADFNHLAQVDLQHILEMIKQQQAVSDSIQHKLYPILKNQKNTTAYEDLEPLCMGKRKRIKMTRTKDIVSCPQFEETEMIEFEITQNQSDHENKGPGSASLFSRPLEE